MMNKWLVLVVASFLTIGGCYEPKPLTCPKRDVFCDRLPGGLCVTAPDGVGYCAYPASDCASMYRWTSYIIPSLENTCVDPVLIEQHNRRDAGADAAQMDGSATN